MNNFGQFVQFETILDYFELAGTSFYKLGQKDCLVLSFYLKEGLHAKSSFTHVYQVWMCLCRF